MSCVVVITWLVTGFLDLSAGGRSWDIPWLPASTKTSCPWSRWSRRRDRSVQPHAAADGSAAWVVSWLARLGGHADDHPLVTSLCGEIRDYPRDPVCLSLIEGSRCYGALTVPLSLPAIAARSALRCRSFVDNVADSEVCPAQSSRGSPGVSVSGRSLSNFANESYLCIPCWHSLIHDN